MKRILLCLCFFVITLSATDEWVKPTQSICQANGGEYSDNTCFSDWESAKKICSSSKANLATKKVFEAVVVKCGGEIEKIFDNKRNRKYQNCYKSLGFSEKYKYWEINTNPSSSGYAGFMTFYVGDGIYDSKKVDNAVVCKNK